MVVLFSGGGTGGHLYPALALADGLVQVRPDVRPFFVGSQHGLEARVLAERGVPHALLSVRGLARGALLSNWRVAPALARALLQVSNVYRRLDPVLSVVTGGYAAGPSGLVAAVCRVPLVVQEQNSVPGLTTRLVARSARQIHLAFPEAAARLPARARQRVRLNGNPVQPLVPIDRTEARAAFGLAPESFTVLVLGGSQGSAALNAAVLEAVRLHPEGGMADGARIGLELLWSTGTRHAADIAKALAELGAPAWVHALGYVRDMPRALAAADLAVSRAGAMATSEFLAWGIPALLVPLPTAAADHQSHNAVALADAGAALHLPEAELSGERLWSTLTRLIAEPDRLDALRAAAQARGRPDSAHRIATAMAELLPPPRGRGSS